MSKLALSSKNFIDPFYNFFDGLDIFTPISSQSVAFSEWSEDGNELFISIEAPGFSRDEIKIEASFEGIRISGEIKNEEIGKRVNNRKFSYILKRNDIDENSIDAKLEAGILEIRLKKQKEKESKIIQIK